MTEYPKRPSVDSLFIHSKASVQKTMGSGAMGKAPKERKAKKPKERWLLTRKTWRYMTDAGRKLIPEGALNRVEDVPKIEAYFQEVCQKEPRFLLWRKGSYPGALGFRSHRRRKERKIGGSCRTKASSADEADDIKKAQPSDLATIQHSGGRFDIQKLKHDFLNRLESSSSSSRIPFKNPLSTTKEEESEESQLANMLEQYLKINSDSQKPNTQQQFGNIGSQPQIDYQELIDKLQQHLSSTYANEQKSMSASANRRLGLESTSIDSKLGGSHTQKGISETLNRYFSKSTNRDRVLSDLLTDRKMLENLYFDLRKSRGFGTNRTGSFLNQPSSHYRMSLLHDERYDTDDESEETTSDGVKKSGKSKLKSSKTDGNNDVPLPVIELQAAQKQKEKVKKSREYGIQTDPITDTVLQNCEEEYKKSIAIKEEEAKEAAKSAGSSRRRSSVDNDDVSQSVSDTIKRYLRMARKKSSDGDKADRFKRINYDKNLRNIKAKNIVDMPSEDDDYNKGCQTEDLWIPSYKEYKPFESSFSGATSEYSSSCEAEELLSPVSTKAPSCPSSPPSFLSTSQSFLSNLLHVGKQHDKSSSDVAPAEMQKSKSSSSVMHHGSRLVAKKIFRSRSKSQSRLQTSQSPWTPQGGCVWSHVTNKQVMLNDCNLLQLSDIERRLLQKVAVAKLQALNLGVTIRPPTETVGQIANKSKRRAYLLRRKAKTTGFFDTARKEDKEKDGSVTGGLVFGIPLSQCIENDRISRLARGGSPFRVTGADLSGDENSGNLRSHGSRSSFSSLVDSPRNEESGSCESLMSRERIAGSVPGLLDTLAYESTVDLQTATAQEEEPGVPQMVTACLKYLQNFGLHTLGIFRVSSSKKRVRQLREDFDSGKETVLDEEQCPHDIATLLKEYLRDLPDPLLCRELYPAFVQTQRIRNRRLQLEAVQHLIQLLPVSNRDTLAALLTFLANVARHAHDTKDASGEWITGNKMDTNNLATIFAPNILHCIKPGSAGKDYGDKSEDRIDVINVVRLMIDHHKQLFSISAEILDEVYIHMMDTHPEALDQLLSKKEYATFPDELLDDADIENSAITWNPQTVTSGDTVEGQLVQEQKKTWSREEFLHEFAGMGGPNMAMRFRHRDRDRGRERSSKKRWRDESGTRRKVEEVQSSGISTAMTIITRFRGQKDEDSTASQQFMKLRSSSMDSANSVPNDGNEVNSRLLRITSSDEHYGSDRRQSSPLLLDNNGVITASLKIPMQSGHQPMSLNLDDSDIPYIEDGSCNYSTEGRKQQMTIGLIKNPTAPPRRRQRSISGSDSSQASSMFPITGSVSLKQQGYDSAMGSSTFSSPPHNTTPSSVGSSIAGDILPHSCPTSWGSSPPTSPDGTHHSINYIPDDILTSKQQIAMSRVPVTTQKLKIDVNSKTPQSPMLQKVSITSTSELQQVSKTKSSEPVKETSSKRDSMSGNTDVSKSTSTASITAPRTDSKGFPIREQKFATSVYSIGGKVLRSKTEDFERLLNISKTSETKTKSTTTTTTTVTEKKKYTKRRYTDSRHETRHIPDSESLEKSTSESISKSKDKGGVVASPASRTTPQQSGPVYKRRELIASVPKERHSIL